MTKKCIRIELNVFVDTDMDGVEDIVNGLEVSVESNHEDLDIDRHEINNFYEVK